jgi:hypothetical protein
LIRIYTVNSGAGRCWAERAPGPHGCEESCELGEEVQGPSPEFRKRAETQEREEHGKGRKKGITILKRVQTNEFKYKFKFKQTKNNAST